MKSSAKFMHFHLRKCSWKVVWKMAAISFRPQCVNFASLFPLNSGLCCRAVVVCFLSVTDPSGLLSWHWSSHFALMSLKRMLSSKRTWITLIHGKIMDMTKPKQNRSMCICDGWYCMYVIQWPSAGFWWWVIVCDTVAHHRFLVVYVCDTMTSHRLLLVEWNPLMWRWKAPWQHWALLAANIGFRGANNWCQLVYQALWNNVNILR